MSDASDSLELNDADLNDSDLAAAAAIVGASSSGEFFERLVATRALELGLSGGFPVSEYKSHPAATTPNRASWCAPMASTRTRPTPRSGSST